MSEEKRTSRRGFMTTGLAAGAAIGMAATVPSVAASETKPSHPLVVDGMMHLEVRENSVGKYGEGLVDEVIELYDRVGIGKGVSSRPGRLHAKSNDRVLKAYERYQ